MKMKLSVPSTVDKWLNNIVERPALAVTVSILWLIVIGWLAYGWNLGTIGLIDETEPLFAEASRQMYVTGDWITPFFNGETRFDKPALIYWCQAIAYAIFGVNEWAVRLPSAIAAIAVMSFAFYTIHWSIAKQDELEKLSRPTRPYITAAVGAALMAFCPEMIVWGRIGVSDMLMTGCIASALLCFFLGYARNEGTREESTRSLFPNNWYLACYVLIAGAILTKGPVGIVLPGLIIGAFLLYLGKFREVGRQMRPLMGLLIILVLSVPWYALVIWRNGWDYINAFFGYHNLERFTEVVNGHSAPWYFYFLVVLLGFAPYSVYLPAAMARLKFWQLSHWRTQERSQQLGLFACFWFLGVFGFFTIAVTKLPSYVLPLMPAAAILVALFWSDLIKDNGTRNQSISRRSFLWSSWVNVAFLSALAVGLFHLSQIIGRDPAAPNLYQLIQQSGLPVYGGFIWLLGALIIAALIMSHRWHFVIGVNLLGFAAFLAISLMPSVYFMDQERQLPLRELSAIAVQVQQPNEEFLMVGFKKPTVVFYTHKLVKYIDTPQEAVDHIHNQTTKQVLPTSLLVLSEQDKFVEMGLQPDEYKHIATKGAYYLFRVPIKKIKPVKLDISYQFP
ncbi:MAG: glycosyltransferase family 39 protein [Gloeotrichia echinulata CP02]|nr:glycosyltransferase family 39 protein [Gloeotrichia echinulata DEX184]